MLSYVKTADIRPPLATQVCLYEPMTLSWGPKTTRYSQYSVKVTLCPMKYNGV